jgi:hypothetical protein
MESDVAASVQSSLAILKEQQAGLVALSEQVSEAALLMEKKLTEFVEQNHQALEDVKQRQSTEKEQHLAQLESLKESVESFAATHHSDSQRLEMEALQRREEAMKAHQSALEAQVEEANARAAACENEATERNAEFEKQSEELLASFTASLTAFKERQISANSEASKMTVKEIQSRAQTHSDEMNELFSEYSAKCNDAEKNGAQLMSDLTTGCETQAVKAVEKLAESSVKTCAQLDVSLDEQARAVKDTVTEVNSMNSEATSFTRQVLSQSEATCTTLVEKVELNGDNVEKKSAKLQAMVSDSETTSSNVVKAMISKSQSVVLENDSHLAQLQQHVNMNNEEVGSKMVAFESEVSNQQKDIAALVCEGGQLFETSMKLAPEHEAVLEKVESSLSTHVASINEPLEVTGNTPEKRKFDRPDEFSQTRPHEVIMKECKGKRSKMVPVLDESATTLTSRSSSKREISEVTSTSSTENDVVPSSSRKGKRRSSSGTESGDVVKNPLMEATNIVDDR